MEPTISTFFKPSGIKEWSQLSQPFFFKPSGKLGLSQQQSIKDFHKCIIFQMIIS